MGELQRGCETVEQRQLDYSRVQRKVTLFGFKGTGFDVLSEKPF